MRTKLKESQETSAAQLSINVPCTDWQVDEPKAVKVRIQSIDFVPSKHQWVESEPWQRLEAHLEAFAFGFGGTLLEEPLC